MAFFGPANASASAVDAPGQRAIPARLATPHLRSRWHRFKTPVQHLKRLGRSRKSPAREVQRGEILWRYHGSETMAEIMRALKMTRKSVGKWVERALAMGLQAALKDAYHRPQQPRISEEAKAWVVHLACNKPKQLGYAILLLKDLDQSYPATRPNARSD